MIEPKTETTYAIQVRNEYSYKWENIFLTDEKSKGLEELNTLLLSKNQNSFAYCLHRGKYGEHFYAKMIRLIKRVDTILIDHNTKGVMKDV